jgi:hypothetical protein
MESIEDVVISGDISLAGVRFDISIYVATSLYSKKDTGLSR